MAQEQTQQVTKYENISQSVLSKIQSYQKDGSLTLPENYAPENQLKSAWLVLQEVKDRNDKLALTVCTKESIANALLDMVLQGLSVSKKQGYFVVYGNKLVFMRSYFGSVALAKNVTKGALADPVANVIYDGDEFAYEINSATGRKKIIKHIQKIENIDLNKIKGAYCITKNGDVEDVEIMTIQQIRNAWNQGPVKGNSGAHKNFTDEMCKKTVIGRSCKMIINSSDDAWLYEDKKDESDADIPTEQRNEVVKTEKKVIAATEIEYTEVAETAPEEQSEPQQQEVDPYQL
jgi:recombination protein RecT